MNLGKLLTLYLKYALFKKRAEKYVETAKQMAELLNDDKARELADDLQKLYDKLP
jgi:hypothetical protein